MENYSHVCASLGARACVYLFVRPTEFEPLIFYLCVHALSRTEIHSLICRGKNLLGLRPLNDVRRFGISFIIRLTRKAGSSFRRLVSWRAMLLQPS